MALYDIHLALLKLKGAEPCIRKKKNLLPPFPKFKCDQTRSYNNFVNIAIVMVEKKMALLLSHIAVFCITVFIHCTLNAISYTVGTLQQRLYVLELNIMINIMKDILKQV